MLNRCATVFGFSLAILLISLVGTHDALATGPPSLSITSPSNGHSVSVGTSITFTATASDSDGNDLSDEVVWTDTLGSILGTSSSVTLTLPAGSHDIIALVRDDGGYGTSRSVTVVVTDSVNTAPQVTITSPGDGLTLPVGYPITFTATATDAEDDNGDLSIRWRSDPPGLSGTGSTISQILHPGSYKITAITTDSGGNTGVDEIRITVQDIVDIEPTIRITSPSQDQTFPSGSSITFTAVAADDEDDNDDLSIRWSSSPSGVTGTGTTVTATLSPGTYFVEATVTDSASNTHIDRVTIVVNEPVVDDPPTIVIHDPQDGYTAAYGAPIVFAATAIDAEDDDDDLSVRWSSSPSGLSGTGEIITDTLEPGSYTITVTATDSGKNTATDTIRISVGNIPDTHPTIRITSPPHNQTFTSNSSITFTAVVADDEDDEQSLNIRWTSNPPGVSGNSSSVVVDILPVGIYTITALVFDSHDNSDTANIQVNVVEAQNLQPPSEEGADQLNDPSGITTNGTHIFVADTSNNRIQILDMNGTYAGQFGASGTGDGQFSTPRGITTNGTHIFVADTSNNRIQVFEMDGTYAGQFGSLGIGNAQFIAPTDVAVSASNIFVADSVNGRIQVFEMDGTYADHIVSFVTPNGYPASPTSLEYDNGLLYVSYQFSNQIRILSVN